LWFSALLNTSGLVFLSKIMYLKNLTVLGFKSFADKTSLNFEPGVTGIVGPNGCGKSNVSDAIRWVLGEQSAKALRGGEMSDVIFNGTDGRKPLGMAEVSLTIGGIDEEHLHAAGVEMSYNEVTVTRRVFRDGGSEYFINKTPCRLKDIQQLFMGTGVGRTSYSIMAQGNITQVLSSKPEDRRMIFEEAAGITKYKAHKREALRKLEYTEQNLLRVADLVREVKRQIGSLQRQAGKARRYKQLAQELQHLDTQLARHQFDVLQADIAEKQSTAERLRREIEEGSEDLLRREDEISELRARLSELEKEIGSRQQKGLELKSEADRHVGRIQFNEERLREFAAQNTKALADITEAEERKRVAEEELGNLRKNLDASEAALVRHREALADRQGKVSKLEEAIRNGQEALRQAQAESFAVAQDLTQVRNEITALDLQKQGNVVRLEKLSAEKIQLEEERRRLEQRLQEFAANVEARKLNAHAQRGTVQQRQQRLEELRQELGRAALEQEALLNQQAETRSKLALLEQLQTDREGFGAGAMAALKQSKLVLGSLADRIRVPDQFITAIETALGHHLELVLTDRPEAAHQILSDLNASKAGRASVAALELSGNGRSAVEESNGENRGQGGVVELNGAPLPAMAVIESEASVRPLLDRLLGGTRIVRDLDAATSAWREVGGELHFVTVGGDLLSSHGIYTGGYLNGKSNGKATTSFLGRKNQITEMRALGMKLQRQVGELSRRKGALQSEQTELQAGLDQAQNDLRAQEVAIATHEGEFNALQSSHRMLGQKIETVVYEVQSLAAQEQEGAQKRSVLAERITDFERRERESQELVSEKTTLLESLRQDRETANAGLTECRVALATEEQLTASFAQQRQSLEQRIAELGRLVEQRRGDLTGFAGRKEQADAEIVQSRAEIGRLEHERNLVNGQTAELVSQRQAEEQGINEREEGLREQRRLHTELQQQRGTIDVELAQKNMSVQNLRERIQQKYHLNLDDIRSECISITFADEGPARVHVMTPEEMAANGAATDWGMVAEQVTALQTRIDEMGPVNLVAIEEYEETEQRHEFLSKQLEDLTQAKAQLSEVINRINTQTREMFVRTFEQIRDNFRTMFTEVFGGGKADLILVDGNDVLESGIDIVARPPGKQLQTISLLSGGEQTMTAVSLLFSIYQVKPSPFCVLDELDAPLDESNINRFIRVLQRFLEHSQFIIITHNKRTIGMADVLYGVTMQEQGVSRIVSVRFHKADDVVTDHKPASLETPTTVRPVELDEDAPHKREDTLEIVMAK
jgi:chromosome segregation protein